MEEPQFIIGGFSGIDSLCAARSHLLNPLALDRDLLKKINKLIALELDLAVMGAEKAIKKVTASNDNVRPIK